MGAASATGARSSVDARTRGGLRCPAPARSRTGSSNSLFECSAAHGSTGNREQSTRYHSPGTNHPGASSGVPLCPIRAISPHLARRATFANPRASRPTNEQTEIANLDVLANDAARSLSLSLSLSFSLSDRELVLRSCGVRHWPTFFPCLSCDFVWFLASRPRQRPACIGYFSLRRRTPVQRAGYRALTLYRNGLENIGWPFDLWTLYSRGDRVRTCARHTYVKTWKW